ncbi:hypothetical protein TNCV_2682711 [Trichonephila clavipes]|nr:hypothetical protein TNCV_2682711 [Trichonephila clavipes]
MPVYDFRIQKIYRSQQGSIPNLSLLSEHATSKPGVSNSKADLSEINKGKLQVIHQNKQIKEALQSIEFTKKIVHYVSHMVPHCPVEMWHQERYASDQPSSFREDSSPFIGYVLPRKVSSYLSSFSIF